MRWEEEQRFGGEVVVLRSTGAERTMSLDGLNWLRERLRTLAEDPPVIVLVLDIVHMDLETVRRHATGGSAEKLIPVPKAIRGLERYPLPVIASVPRQATAGGCELALGCDLRVVNPRARVGLYETTMGIIPAAGGTQRLPRLVGLGQAGRLIFSGEAISGEEAGAIGLSEIVAEDAEQAAVDYARRIAGNGQSVLAAAKRALRAAVEQPLKEGLLIEGEAFTEVAGEPQAAERLSSWSLPREDA